MHMLWTRCSDPSLSPQRKVQLCAYTNALRQGLPNHTDVHDNILAKEAEMLSASISPPSISEYAALFLIAIKTLSCHVRASHALLISTTYYRWLVTLLKGFRCALTAACELEDN